MSRSKAIIAERNVEVQLARGTATLKRLLSCFRKLDVKDLWWRTSELSWICLSLLHAETKEQKLGVSSSNGLSTISLRRAFLRNLYSGDLQRQRRNWIWNFFFKKLYTHMYTYVCVWIYMYILIYVSTYVYMCVYVCMCTGWKDMWLMNQRFSGSSMGRAVQIWWGWEADNWIWVSGLWQSLRQGHDKWKQRRTGVRRGICHQADRRAR